MSDHARHVLALIDAAERTRERNPTLFAAQLRAGEKTGRDRDVRHLAAAVAAKKREKPAAHARPFRDQVEPIDDPDWINAETQRSEERHGRRRRSYVNHLREQRASTPLEQRLLTALAVIKRFSTVPAGGIERVSPGSEQRAGVPQQQTVDLQTGQRLLGNAVRWYESVADDLLGIGIHREIATMTAEEKDHLLRTEFVGWTPAEIEASYPALGTVRHIEVKRRKQFGQFARDGQPDPTLIYDPELKEYRRAPRHESGN